MTTSTAVTALYRPTRRHDWRESEIVGEHAGTGQLVLRETGKFYRCVWLADRDTVRIAGPEFQEPRR